MSKIFKIKNKQIGKLCIWLQGLRLGGIQNRARVNILDIFVVQLDVLDKARVALIMKYARKDKDGNPELIIGQEGKKVYDVPDEEMEKLNVEYETILEQDFSIEINENSVQIFKEAKDLILYTDYIFGPTTEVTGEEKHKQIQLEEDYNIWCKSFDEI